MGRKKIVKEEGLEVLEDAKIEVKSKEASVYGKGGEFIRTYSQDIHGKDYLKLAEGFAGKVGGTVK